MPSLRKFPYKGMMTRPGTIGGFLFESATGRQPTLFHEIEVPLEPFVAYR